MSEPAAANARTYLTVQERDLLDKKAQLAAILRYVAATWPETQVRHDYDLPDRCRYEVRMPDRTIHGLGCCFAFDTGRAVFFDDCGSYDTGSLKGFTDYVLACAEAAAK
jgi:hypothetical protein